MIKGFFFDLDGTLVDTHQANFEAYQLAIHDVSGINITFDDFKSTIGHVATTFLPWFAPGLSQDEYRQIATLKAEYYKDLMHLTQLNEQLIGFMGLMRQHKLVLVTTAKRKNAEAVLSHHKLGGFFEHIITAEDVEHSKPEPDAYELALDKTGLLPSEAIAFEDSEAGRQAAETAGIAVMMIDTFKL